jgi:hypothetical protein
VRETGHIKLSRKAFEGDALWLEKRELSKWEAWVWMIQSASWKDNQRVFGMTVVPLKRGEFVASVRYLAESWGWKRSRVHEFLRLLIQMERISGQRETQIGTVYLLVNYDAYQSAPDKDRTPDRTPSGHRADKVKEVKEELLIGRAKARPIPEEWKPSESHTEMAAREGLTVHAEAEHFRDHHTARGSLMKDWDAAFRTWLRNAVKFGGKRTNGAQPETPEKVRVWDETKNGKFQ